MTFFSSWPASEEEAWRETGKSWWPTLLLFLMRAGRVLAPSRRLPGPLVAALNYSDRV